MNIDDRLRHAFSDLEHRVNTQLEDREAHPTAEPRRMPRFLIPALAATIVIVAIGLAAWLSQGTDDVEPVISTPETTTTPPTTTAPPTTIEPAPGAAQLLPAGTQSVIAGDDGGWARSSDGSLVRVVAEPISAIDGVSDGRFVYQLPNGGDIVLADSNGSTVMVSSVAGELEMFGIVEYVAGEPMVAYTVAGGEGADRVTTLHFDSIDAPDNDIQWGEVGDFESFLLAVSTSENLVVLQTSSGGFVNTRGIVAGETVDLGLPTPSCETEPGPCHVGTVTTPDGRRFVSVLFENGEHTLIVTEAGSGAVEYSVPLPDLGLIADLDVAWPIVVVNPETPDVGDPVLVDLSDVDPTAERLPAGRAHAVEQRNAPDAQPPLEPSGVSSPSFVVATEEGIFEIVLFAPEQISPSVVAKAFRVSGSQVVTLSSDAQTIALESLEGREVSIVAEAEPGGSLDLSGVFETADGTVIVYESAPAPDFEDIESIGSWLGLYDVETGVTIEGGRIDGFESGGSVTSYADGQWIVDMSGEGFRWHYAYDAATFDRIELDDPVPSDCVFDAPGCPHSVTRVADPDVWVFVDDTEGVERSAIVVIDGETGADVYAGRTDLGDGIIEHLDVSWPFAVADMQDGRALLVDLEAGGITELPLSGFTTLG